MTNRIYKFITTKEVQIVLLCALNLLYMHYSIFFSDKMEFELDPHSFFDNFWGVLFDVFVLLFAFYLISLGKIRISLTITFFITLIWSFCNVLYFRFFFHYISLSVIGQVKVMSEGFMQEAAIQKIAWADLFYIIVIILFVNTYRNLPQKPHPHFINKYVLVLALFFIFCIGIRVSQFVNCIRFYLPTLEKLYFSTSLYICAPNSTTFRRGCTRVLSLEIINKLSKPLELTSDQNGLIRNNTELSRKTFSKANKKKSYKNLIFILVESYMSFTSDLIIEGQEITPSLNTLKHDKNVYFNGHMTPNISIGESSDGQFIYMTGILPLQSSLTISSLKETNLPGLPRQTSKLFEESRMIIPTSPYIWDQQRMSNLYGFKKLYSSYDYNHRSSHTLNDFEVFELAKQIDKKSTDSFFSIILTMSMHYPYEREIDSYFHIKTKSIPQELRYYLNACHYTDKAIGNYLSFLKENGLYDKSLIVIASDHHVHTADFGEYKSHEIPIYIINGTINSDTGWQGSCNQLDLYTTLLDLLDINSKWNGLGHSLNSKSYDNSISEEKWEISEWIIKSDYFGNIEYSQKVKTKKSAEVLG